MPSKLLDDTFRPPRDPFVTLGVYDAPIASLPSAPYLLEAHRLVAQELSSSSSSPSSNVRLQQDSTFLNECSKLHDSLRDRAHRTRLEYARLREQLWDLFGTAAATAATDESASCAVPDQPAETAERRARRSCVACEMFVGAFARLEAKQRRAEASRRRGRVGDDDSETGSRSLLEHALDLPAGYFSHALPAATQREQRDGTQSRKALLTAQTLRRDTQVHVVSTVLPALAAQTNQLKDDLDRIEELRGRKKNVKR